MAIRERPDGRWQAVVTIRVHGRVERHTKLAPKGAGKRQAKQLEDEIRTELATKRRSSTATSTLIEHVDRWLELHATTVRKTSADEYRRRVTRWIRPHPIAAVRLAKLTPQHIDAHLALLARSGIGGRSVQMVHALLHAALEDAVRWELIHRNPAHGARRIPINARKPEVPADDLVVQAVTAARTISDEWGLWLHLLVITGARRGEISALRWSDIDLKAGTLTIARTLGPKGHIGSTKNGGIRTVHLDADTLTRLNEAWAATRELAATIHQARPVTRWLFTGDADGHTHHPYDWATWQWTKTRTLVPGLKTIRMHDLRHRAATTLIAAGIPITVVAGRLGHSPTTLTRTYTHETTDHGAAAAAAALN